MLSQLDVTLIEILLGAFLFFAIPLGQLQKDIILDILELNGRYPSLYDSFPEGINMDLHERDRSDE